MMHHINLDRVITQTKHPHRFPSCVVVPNSWRTCDCVLLSLSQALLYILGFYRSTSLPSCETATRLMLFIEDELDISKNNMYFFPKYDYNKVLVIFLA